MPENVSPELRRFINEHVGSIAQLELLLLLAGDPAKTIDAEEASRVFYVTVDAARAFLETMAADGLLAAEPGGKFRFAPRHAEWAQLVETLGQTYRERRPTVIEIIYTGPLDALQSFADAFRIRKGDKDK